MSTTENGTSHTHCIHCGSARRVRVGGKVSDSFEIISMSGRHGGYVPANIGFGDNEDYIEFEMCLDCNRLQKTGPVRRIKDVDAPLHKGQRKAKRAPGVALPELQSMPAKWPGQCACGAAYEAGEAIDYSLTIQAVVGCPCCNAKRAAKAA